MNRVALFVGPKGIERLMPLRETGEACMGEFREALGLVETIWPEIQRFDAAVKSKCQVLGAAREGIGGHVPISS